MIYDFCKNVRKLLFSFAVACLFCACDSINEPANEFFDTYNQNARLGAISYPSGSSDSQGILCLDSNSEKKFSFEITNPQGLRVSLSYTFAAPLVQQLADSISGSVTIRQNSDKNSGTVVFSKGFLNQLDYYNYAGKAISGTIAMDERYGRRSFDSAKIQARTDSAPPAVIGAMLQKTSYDDSGKYVLCFYLPKTYGTVHQNDLSTLIINGRTFYTYNPQTYTESATIADIYEDSQFKSQTGSTDPQNDTGEEGFYTSEPLLFALGESTFGGISATPSDAYRTVYYYTNTAVTEEEKSFTITLQDDSGLSATKTVTNTGTSSSSDEVTEPPEDNPTYFYVSASGSDDTGDGTAENPYASVNKALEKMKAAFVADSTMTEGTVYLLSDISCAGLDNGSYNFIDFEPLQLAGIGSIESITIKGYGSQRSINANMLGRVMHIGWTKNDIILENLILIGGKTSGETGGSGLFVSSSGIDTSPTLTIRNCYITGNTSEGPGTGILLKSEYAVNITDSMISGNTLMTASKNGAAGIESTQIGTKTYITIKDSSIVGNTVVANASDSLDFGFALNGDGYTKMEGVTITGNKASLTGSGDSSKIAAVKNSRGINLQGSCKITGNSLSLTTDSGTSTFSRNIVLTTSSDTATSTDMKLAIMGALSGTIGVQLASGTPKKDVTFTSGYSGSGSAHPSTVFEEDSSYAIGRDSSGEAAIVVGSGRISDSSSLTMSFAVDASEFTVGSAKALTVTPTVTLDGNDITSSAQEEMTWKLTLFSGTTDTGISSDSSTLTIPETAYAGAYTLHVSASYRGITQDAEFAIIGRSS